MKHLANKERRRDREEFCYRHREEVVAASLGQKYKYNTLAKDIVRKARIELGYSEKTVSEDIWCSLSKTLNKIKDK